MTNSTYSGTLIRDLERLAESALQSKTRIYVLQNSSGRVLEVPAIRISFEEAQRRNKNLARLNSDYRWSLVV
jgi:hypothetical protein